MIFNPFSNASGVKLKRHGPGSGGIVVKSFDPLKPTYMYIPLENQGLDTK